MHILVPEHLVRCERIFFENINHLIKLEQMFAY